MDSGWKRDIWAAMVILLVCGFLFSAFVVALVAMVGCLVGAIGAVYASDWLRALACFGGLVVSSGIGLGAFALMVTFPGNYYFHP